MLNVKVSRNVIMQLKKHKQIIYKLLARQTSDLRRRQILLKHLDIIRTIALVPRSIERSILKSNISDNPNSNNHGSRKSIYQNVSNQ